MTGVFFVMKLNHIGLIAGAALLIVVALIEAFAPKPVGPEVMSLVAAFVGWLLPTPLRKSVQ